MKSYSYSEANSLEYPYFWASDEGLDEAFEALKADSITLKKEEYKIPELTHCGVNAWINVGNVIHLNKWNESHMISSYFNQNVRVRCKKANEEMSPYDYWQKNKKAILSGKKQVTNRELDEAIWAKIRGCDSFRPVILLGLIRLLKSKSVLDFSSGWGDRLIAAIAAEVRYVGVDPNTKLVASYRKIIERFVPTGKQDMYTMIPEPFQTCSLPEGEKYDLVFTSPPYFDLEVYSNDTTQSYFAGQSLNSWLITFLFPSLTKAWNALNINGTMCININDSKLRHYVDTMISYMKTVKGSGDVTLLPYQGERKHPQPIWIWTKRAAELQSFEYERTVLTAELSRKVHVFQTKEVYVNSLRRLLEPISGNIIIFSGSSNEIELISCLRSVCDELNKKLVVYTQDVLDGSDVVYVRSSASLEARKYHARTQNSYMFDSTDPIFQYILMQSLDIKLEDNSLALEPKRVIMNFVKALLSVLGYKWASTVFFLANYNAEMESEYAIPEHLKGRIRDAGVTSQPKSNAKPQSDAILKYSEVYSSEGDYVFV